MINECIDLDVYGIVQQICKIELAYCSFSSIITRFLIVFVMSKSCWRTYFWFSVYNSKSKLSQFV